MLTNCKNGISSYEIARDVRSPKNRAWFMLHRIRLALQDAILWEQLAGEVEVDETFIGGKSRNMHMINGSGESPGLAEKTKLLSWDFLSAAERSAQVFPDRRKKNALQAEVRKHVEAGAALYTDALPSYNGLASEYAHQVVDHAVEYVNGRIHTNGLENFWSSLEARH